MTEWSRIARRIRVPVGFAFAVAYLWLAHPSWTFLGWGGILIFAGLIVRARASGHVQKNEALAISGPYAYARNPLYLGSLLIAIGFCIAARNLWIGLVLLLMFLGIYLPVIKSEEAFLRERFPEFEDYAQNVPRMFPRITPYRPGSGKNEGKFSFNLYLKHREYNALLGALGILTLLVAKMKLLR